MLKRIVITGASTGIGAELAVRYAQKGAKVVAAARGEQALASVVERCGGNAFAVACDVAEPEQCRALVQRSVEKLGGIDAFVNNAGVTMRARFDEVDDLSLFERLMRVNYLGAVYCTHFALPHIKQSRGLIVAVSSVTGLFGIPTRTGYAASKHAMQGFFDSLRIELMGSGVDVLVVSPGVVATDVRARALGAMTAVNPEGERSAMSVEECVSIMAEAMDSRRREVVMTWGARLALWAARIAPGAVDRRIAARTRNLA
jgi:short-subunit dehydrogenase